MQRTATCCVCARTSGRRRGRLFRRRVVSVSASALVSAFASVLVQALVYVRAFEGVCVYLLARVSVSMSSRVELSGAPLQARRMLSDKPSTSYLIYFILSTPGAAHALVQASRFIPYILSTFYARRGACYRTSFPRCHAARLRGGTSHPTSQREQRRRCLPAATWRGWWRRRV